MSRVNLVTYIFTTNMLAIVKILCSCDHDDGRSIVKNTILQLWAGRK